MDKINLELLSAAGSYETFLAVVDAGADAVYAGGSMFGARAYAANLTDQEIISAIDLMHLKGKKFYLTVNTLVKDGEMQKNLYDYLDLFYKQGLDAVIVQDVGVIEFIKENFPRLDVHCSTQMSITSLDGAIMAKENGAARIVTPRELSLDEIKYIHENVDIEIESFIHGALCYCYSGQCLMSSLIGGRSGNRGRCAQPCRLPYDVIETNGKLRNKKNKYVLSLKDLCTLDILPDIIDAGVMSFKIEGRMKRVEYAAGVTSVYRKYIELYKENGKNGYFVEKKDLKYLMDLGNRNGFTNTYYFKHNGSDMVTFDKPDYSFAGEEFFKTVKKQLDNIGNNKEKIKGTIIINADENVKMIIEHDGKKEEYISHFIPQPAQKQPLTVEKVKKQLEKTGNMPFEFENLEVYLQEGLFMPVNWINDIRRNAIEKLQITILNSFKRDNLEDTAEYNSFKKIKKYDKIDFNVLVNDEKQLNILIPLSGIDSIYIDYNIFELPFNIKKSKKIISHIRQNNKKAIYVMPYIFRKDMAKQYEKMIDNINAAEFSGVMFRSYDEYEFLLRHQYKGMLIADSNIYSFNQKAKQFFNMKNVKTVIPIELNEKELKKRSCTGDELIIYGNVPVMISAQCVNKNTKSCSKDNKVLYLKDRYNKQFITKCCCEGCYNVIYNSVPTVLADKYDNIQKLAPSSVRMDFTFESANETEKIAKYCIDIINNNVDNKMFDDFTRGHFTRGVE